MVAEKNENYKNSLAAILMCQNSQSKEEKNSRQQRREENEQSTFSIE